MALCHCAWLTTSAMPCRRLPILALLGFVHFHHLAPKPDGYAFPYPDFLQRVYVAEAQDFIPKAMELGEYELETGFRAIDEALALPLEPGQRLWLRAALR